jgi:hypothetical protein
MSSGEPREEHPRGLWQAIGSMILIPLAFALWSAWTAWQAGEIFATICSAIVIVAAASLALYLVVPARNRQR